MDYVAIINELWAADKIEAAVRYKERCVKDGALTDEELVRLKHIPSLDEWINGLLTDPPKDKVAAAARVLYQFMENDGWTETEMQERGCISEDELREIREKKLTRRGVYNRFLVGLNTWAARQEVQRAC